mmetsp:Transcript_12907/g.18553  ORF Transcript_12907/g.18553 Transcript_12907/m.18553 type:complete len:189 (-) Transcript_12907:1031-1597(-)
MSDFLIKASFSSTTEVVEKMCSQFEHFGRRIYSPRQMDAPAPAETVLMLTVTEGKVSAPSNTVSSGAASLSHPNRPFKCESCHLSFRSVYELKRHRKNFHEGRREFPCSYCERDFSQLGHRNEPEKMDHCDEGKECNICGKKFPVESKLERHVRTVHEQIRNYECSTCGLRLKQKSHLMKHRFALHKR